MDRIEDTETTRDHDSPAEGSSDEEEDRRAFGIWQALPVAAREPDWEKGEVEDVEEYLCRVRWEAKQLPNTVVATEQPVSLDTPSTASIPGDLADPDTCDASLLPNADWLHGFLEHFERLRDRVQWELAQEAGNLDSALGNLGLGQEECIIEHPLQAPSCSSYGPSIFDSMPELAELRSLRPPTVAQRIPSCVGRLVKTGLAPEVAAELFALSIRVEKPLRPDTCAAYRRLLRHSCGLRAGLATDSKDDRLPLLNILIAIAGGVFEQGPVDIQ